MAEWDMKEERSAAGRKNLAMSGRQLAHAEHDEPKIKSLRKNPEPWGDSDMPAHNFRDHCVPTQRYRDNSPVMDREDNEHLKHVCMRTNLVTEPDTAWQGIRSCIAKLRRPPT
jgi:hypothetical protein